MASDIDEVAGGVSTCSAVMVEAATQTEAGRGFGVASSSRPGDLAVGEVAHVKDFSAAEAGIQAVVQDIPGCFDCEARCCERPYWAACVNFFGVKRLVS